MTESKDILDEKINKMEEEMCEKEKKIKQTESEKILLTTKFQEKQFNLSIIKGNIQE